MRKRSQRLAGLTGGETSTFGRQASSAAPERAHAPSSFGILHLVLRPRDNNIFRNNNYFFSNANGMPPPRQRMQMDFSMQQQQQQKKCLKCS